MVNVIEDVDMTLCDDCWPVATAFVKEIIEVYEKQLSDAKESYGKWKEDNAKDLYKDRATSEWLVNVKRDCDVQELHIGMLGKVVESLESIDALFTEEIAKHEMASEDIGDLGDIGLPDVE